MAIAHKTTGFTLIEMVMAIVLLGISAAILAPFITQSAIAYRDTTQRTEITDRGRVALERMAREARDAVPNSLETFADGFQFLAARTGGVLVAMDDDFGAAFSQHNRRFEKGVNKSRLYSLTGGITSQTGDYLIIGNTSTAEIKSADTLSQLTGVSATALNPDGTSSGNILIISPHKYSNDSPGGHYQISNTTVNICLVGNTLRWRSSSAMDDYDGSCSASISDPILVDGVVGGGSSFEYSPGSPSSSGVLRVSLRLQNGETEIDLYREIQMRNTP